MTASGSTVDYDGSLAEASRRSSSATSSAVTARRCRCRPSGRVATASGGPGARTARRPTRCCGRCRRRTAARSASPSSAASTSTSPVRARRSPRSVPLRWRFPGRSAVDGSRHPRAAAARQRCGRVAGGADRTPAGAARVDAGVVVPPARHDPAGDHHGARAPRRARSRAVTWVGGRLPSRRLVVLEADGGRSFDGNVRAIGDGLAGVRPDVAQAWIHRSNPARVPPGAEAVDRQSLRAAWLLARAAVVVSDGTAAPLTPPGPRALVVNAGTGVPFHRLGLDDPSVLVSRAAVASVRRRARQWRLLLAPSPESARILRGAFGYSGPSAEVGLPRIDGPAAARRQDLARHCDSASTCRPTGRSSSGRPAPRPAGASTELLDLEAWAAALGTRTYLLVRGLAGEGAAVPTRLRSSRPRPRARGGRPALPRGGRPPRLRLLVDHRRCRGPGPPGRPVPAGPRGVRQPHARAVPLGRRGRTRRRRASRRSSTRWGGGSTTRRPGMRCTARVGAPGRHGRPAPSTARPPSGPSTRSSPAWSGDDQAADRHHGQQHRRARWRPAGRPRRGAASRRARLSRRPRRRGAALAAARVRRRPGVPSLHADAGRVAGAAARRAAGHAAASVRAPAHRAASRAPAGRRRTPGRGARRRPARHRRDLAAVGDGAPGRGAARRLGRHRPVPLVVRGRGRRARPAAGAGRCTATSTCSRCSPPRTPSGSVATA